MYERDQYYPQPDYSGGYYPPPDQNRYSSAYNDRPENY